MVLEFYKKVSEVAEDVRELEVDCRKTKTMKLQGMYHVLNIRNYYFCLKT